MKCTSALMASCAIAFCIATARGQTTPRSVKPILSRPIQAMPVTAFQVQEFLLDRAPTPPAPKTAREWAAAETRLRGRLLQRVAFHGWPPAWINSPPRFEEVGVIETPYGYRLHKLRYEVVPGFWSTAILYEPEHVHGRMPAILSVVGHFRWGKSEEWVQKRCINFAKRGILTLSLEWLGYGELFVPENTHNFYGPHVDLAGANVLGLFYLWMRRGLDYLATRPDVDPTRIGMTGLSGGGWQTVVLSALDPRVKVAVEVAGIGGYASNILQHQDTDEAEDDAPDFNQEVDYSTLFAMRAPRPTLLIHNAEDDCCFRAMLVKPYIYDAVLPFFKLFGQPGALAWHENLHPGTHNYQLDNRQHGYRFFTRYFGLPVAENEIPSDGEIESYQQLKVGLPGNNLTLLGLGREFAARIHREPVPADSAQHAHWVAAARSRLRSVVRYKPVNVKGAWRIWNSKQMGVESLDYRFDFSDGLSATGTWLQAIAVPGSPPATIILADHGRRAASELVSDRVNRGEQVLALDLIMNGEMRPEKPDSSDYDYLMDVVGVRPLGLEVAQLIATAQWLARTSGIRQLRVETIGIRNQVIALTASAIDPSLFSRVVTHQGMHSLGYLFRAPVTFRQAPDLFCLDLYKFFDLDRLITMAAPVRIEQEEYIVAPRTD